MKPFFGAGNHRSKQNIRDLLALLLPQFHKHRLRLLLGFLALFGVDFLQLTIPGYLKKGVDSLATGVSSEKSLLCIGGYILFTALVIALLRFCWRTLIIGFSRRLEEHLRNALFHHILEMDRPFFDDHTTGDIMAHATNDLSAVQMACGMGLVAAADACVMSFAALFFMATISPTLTMIAILPMPLLAFCAKTLSGKLHQRFDRVQEQFSLLTEFVRKTMISIRLIKGYTREEWHKQEFATLGWQYRAANIQVAVIQGLLFPVATLVGNTGMLLVLYFGGKLVIGGQITLGDFVAFITYLYMLIWPMMAVGWVTNLAQRGFTSLARIKRLLDTRPLLLSTIHPKDEPDITFFSFACHALSFRYPGSTVAALQDCSLEIHPGILGIAGTTGAGKSTLCRLLTRQYQVEPGMLFFSGQDVRRFSPGTIRRQISYVSQQPVLFSGTVAENIAFAKPDAPLDEIIRVARLAAIHDEITDMAHGYDEVVGERGVRLSGGQKQRIAIARAILADRPIIIIDDALSALDNDTEQQVFSGIVCAMQGKTVIIVSHRIPVLSGAETILIMDDGRIVDQGTHGQLFAGNALYQTMAAKQQGLYHA